jgi:uncharacterized protein YjbI with pentapeptide repeats
MDDADTWRAYWQAQGMPWRTEPDIPAERQAYLAERRAIVPSIKQGVYPFRGIESKLTRADIEWLLATHESQGIVGPVIWKQEKDKPEEDQRRGLDLRGADLSDLYLRALPLDSTQAGLTFSEGLVWKDEQKRNAAAQLRGATLSMAQLEHANLGGAQLEHADLYKAELTGAILYGAQLTHANLASAQLTGADLSRAQLDHADLSHAQLMEADVFGAYLENADLRWAQLMRARLGTAQLTKADLSGAQLEHADLSRAQLMKADLNLAQLTQANLSGAQLTEAKLISARLDHANLDSAQLIEANLNWAKLPGATLDKAQLTGAILADAQLTDATLTGALLKRAHLHRAQLEGAYLDRARLEDAHLDQARLAGASLRLAFFDSATTLNDVTLHTPEHGAAKLADIRWGGVNLAVIAWDGLIAGGLGDEQAAWNWNRTPFASDKTQSRKEQAAARRKWQEEQATKRLQAFQEAVRANRQLATALRDQGMNEEADAFAYRAQILQRTVFAKQGKRGRATLSLFLDLLAGHGYKPARSLYTYLGVLFGFAFLFFLAGNGWLTFGLPASQYQNLPWYEALILSVSSFHGRGFFQPLQTLGDPVAIIASVEAVFGLFIEVAFIATFTQRFFGK